MELSFTSPDATRSPVISCELAHTHGERQLGLMYRKKLEPESGMLFIFPGETERSFWMKNTYLELDMIFVNSNFEVVSVIHRAVPQSVTPRKSKKPAKYVVEVLGGSAERWGIVPGSKMSVQAPLPEAR